MLTIRLQRTGTKNKPAFRLVLAQAYKAAGKKFVEVLGHYNPRTKAFGLKDETRLKYWLSQHVHLSPTVHNLLVDKKFVETPKVKAWRPKVKPQSETPAAPAAQAQPAPAQETPATSEPAAVPAAPEPASEAPAAPAETPAETPQA